MSLEFRFCGRGSKSGLFYLDPFDRTALTADSVDLTDQWGDSRLEATICGRKRKESLRAAFCPQPRPRSVLIMSDSGAVRVCLRGYLAGIGHLTQFSALEAAIAVVLRSFGGEDEGEMGR